MENFDSPDKSSDKTTTSYNLSAFKQLIDLNGDSVNFEVFFTIKCENEDTVFDMLVIDQENLDKNQVLKYKKITDGGISGKVKANTNAYLNYFLILKSETECPVTVEITKRELDESEIEYQEQDQQDEQQYQEQEQKQYQQQDQQYQQQLSNNIQNNNYPIHPHYHINEKSGVNWKKVIIVCVIISSGIGLYFYFTRTKKEEKENSKRSEKYITKSLEQSDRSIDFSQKQKAYKEYKEYKEQKEKNVPSFQVRSQESSQSSNYKSYVPPVIKKQEITSVRSSDTSSSSKQVAVSSLIQRLKNARKNRK